MHFLKEIEITVALLCALCEIYRFAPRCNAGPSQSYPRPGLMDRGHDAELLKTANKQHETEE